MSGYNLRSSTTSKHPLSSISPVRPSETILSPCSTSLVSKPSCSSTISKSEPPTKKSKVSTQCRRKVKKKQHHIHPPTICTIYDLPPDVLLHIGTFLDSKSLVALYRTCHWFKDLLEDFDPFWKMVCLKEEFLNCEGLVRDDGDHKKIGWAGKPMRINPVDVAEYKKIYLKGLQMRRNVLDNNFEGWRIYANKLVPMTTLSPKNDVFNVLRSMGSLTKLSANDDIKVDWDEKYLVVFHFYRNNGENCSIWVYNIENNPCFLYCINKGLEYTTDRVIVHKGHVVIIPSWPLNARAVVMTLSIENKMNIVGKYLFDNEAAQTDIDKNWMHTVLRVVRDKALVACRIPDWTCVVTDLPTCNLLYKLDLSEVGIAFDCQQIWYYMDMSVILFAVPSPGVLSTIVTLDVTATSLKLRSVYETTNVVDLALFTDPAEIFLIKKTGDVVFYDPNTKTETMKIKNRIKVMSISDGPPPLRASQPSEGEYQLFVNRRAEICVMQSSAEVACGRYVKVFDYSTCKELYTINLDLWKYGMSRDESLCIYSNQAFLAAANSKKLLLFNVKTGRHMGAIQIPNHMERAAGKDDSSCMYEPTGLNLFIFDGDRLITVHDYERSFPAVLDIYKFW